MATRVFDSLEDAAMGGFPPKYCRVVASRVRGDDAYVLLDTGSDGNPYLYGVNCTRRDGHWCEGGSSNGPGWSQAGPDDLLGTLVVWDEAPPDATYRRVPHQRRVDSGKAIPLMTWPNPVLKVCVRSLHCPSFEVSSRCTGGTVCESLLLWS